VRAGSTNAVFVIKIGSTLTTASTSAVTLIGSAQAKNVYWQIGSSATLGTGTAFKGNIVALQSITLNTGATLSGRALARNGAVTLDSNAITLP
jgi:type VI secretion system secreted protein VgrG